MKSTTSSDREGVDQSQREAQQMHVNQFDPRDFQQSEHTLQTVSPLITRGSWGKNRPDYSAYTDQNTQRTLAAACRARKMSSCGSKQQLARRLSASGVPPHLVKEVSKEPDWRDAYRKRLSREQGENLGESKTREGTVFSCADGTQFSQQTAGEDDETQPPQLESQDMILETPRSAMPPSAEPLGSRMGFGGSRVNPLSSTRKREPSSTPTSK